MVVKVDGVCHVATVLDTAINVMPAEGEFVAIETGAPGVARYSAITEGVVPESKLVVPLGKVVYVAMLAANQEVGKNKLLSQRTAFQKCKVFPTPARSPW